MKINEKNLCMFATTSPVDLEGWLNKRGEVNKSWQRRWFVLKGNLLFYFEKKGDKEPLGMIILEGCTIELAEEGDQYCFQIIFHGPNNRTYYLSTESQTNMEKWMKALTCAGYDYMKLMVAELQRQLDEIEGCKDQTPEKHTSAPKPPPRRQNPFNRPMPQTPIAISSELPNDKNEIISTTVVPTIHNQSQIINKTPIVTRKAPDLPTSASTSSLTKATTPVTVSSTSDLVKMESSSNSEFSFERLHNNFGKSIIEDICKWKLSLSKMEEPLILF
uniref:Putative phospholipid binding protein n=1 Tax=Corethrella appendiculata TaxID=1370023 RepID=U5EF85_9DIPT